MAGPVYSLLLRRRALDRKRCGFSDPSARSIRVFEDVWLTRAIADRLRDRELIARSKVFPYQLLAAFLNIDPAVPKMVAEALMDAAEAATETNSRIVLSELAAPSWVTQFCPAVSWHLRPQSGPWNPIRPRQPRHPTRRDNLGRCTHKNALTSKRYRAHRPKYHTKTVFHS